jgi:hypothetical protein
VVERWGAGRGGRRYLSPDAAAAFSHVMLLKFETHHTERSLYQPEAKASRGVSSIVSSLFLSVGPPMQKNCEEPASP